MGKCTLSQDILAVCLVLADGDIDLTLAEVVRRAEGYQERADRHFGISTSDFRGLMCQLLPPGSCWACVARMEGVGEEVRLREVIGDILGYHDGWCNDEGEGWIPAEPMNFRGESQAMDMCDMEQDMYQEHLRLKEELQRFFGPEGIAGVSAASVRQFMRRMHITDDFLRQFSRPGESS